MNASILAEYAFYRILVSQGTFKYVKLDAQVNMPYQHFSLEMARERVTGGQGRKKRKGKENAVTFGLW